MANDYVAIADFVADALDVARTRTTDLLLAAPTVARMPRIAPADGGTTHKYNKYTGSPVVGFRSENDGRENDHSEDTVVSVSLKIADFSFAADMAVADLCCAATGRRAAGSCTAGHRWRDRTGHGRSR